MTDKPAHVFVGHEVKTLPDEAFTSIVRNLTGPRYPTAITVYCDRCYVDHPGIYVVTDDIGRDERLGFARARMRTIGWSCDEHGDYCPDCRPAGAEKGTWR